MNNLVPSWVFVQCESNEKIFFNEFMQILLLSFQKVHIYLRDEYFKVFQNLKKKKDEEYVSKSLSNAFPLSF